MTFKKFLALYAVTPVIDAGTFPMYSDQPADLRRQVRGWVEKGYILPLKRGLYIFSPEWRRTRISSLFLANFLVFPSYISLEYALAYHGLIPEAVSVLTSVTTRKTQTYNNVLGTFEYRSIRPELFAGYETRSDAGLEFFIARPEKALLDFFYLNRSFEGTREEFESLRLQNLDSVNADRLRSYAQPFNNRVRLIAESLARILREESDRLKRL